MIEITHPAFMPVASFITLLWSALSTQADLIAASPFSLGDVRINARPFQHDQKLGHRYPLALDIDRFSEPFRIEAGLEPKASMYPNWGAVGSVAIRWGITSPRSPRCGSRPAMLK